MNNFVGLWRKCKRVRRRPRLPDENVSSRNDESGSGIGGMGGYVDVDVGYLNDDHSSVVDVGL